MDMTLVEIYLRYFSTTNYSNTTWYHYFSWALQMLLRVMRLLWYTSFPIYSLPSSPHHSLSTLFHMNATIPSFIIIITRIKKNSCSISGIPTYSGQFYLKPAIPLPGLICWYLHHQLLLIWSHWKLYCIISAQLWLGCSSMVTMAEWQL